MVCDTMSFDIKLSIHQPTRRHTATYLQNYTVSHPTRQQLWWLRLWGP